MLKGLRSFIVGYGVLVTAGIGSVTALLFFRPQILWTIFARNGFTPHGYCLLWEPGLVWLYVVSDTLIGLSYVAISFLLAYLVHRARREIPFHRVFLAFGAFIIACGSTHFMDVWTLWNPMYWLAGSLKFMTAVASVATAVALPPFLPRTLAMLSEAKLSNQRKQRLESANAELSELYNKTAELDRLKTQFFATVSHELRTPLTLILGPAERLLSDGSLSEEQAQSLELIKRNADALLKHVNDLLDVAKLDAGRMDLAYSNTDLAKLVQHTSAYFTDLAQEREIDFVVDAPLTVPAQVDVEKVQRISFNLLANAFKFTPVGGAVQATVRASETHATIIVDDTGPGVRPELRNVIFEPYRQGDEAISGYMSGTGLGLAIAKDFVDLHGGTIAVEDAPIGGARFVVELPLTAPSNSIVQTVTDQPLPPITVIRHEQHVPIVPVTSTQADSESRPLILVVEDNLDMRAFIVDSLAGDYRIAAAVNGKEGLQQALTVQPDLIVSDIMMPEMGGDEFVSLARSYAELNAVPIVLLSARANDELRIELLRNGAQDYLVKPFSVEELRARLANLITMKRTRDILQQALASRTQDVSSLAHDMMLRKRELEEAVSVRDVFLSIASHELKTPITALLGYTELLHRRMTRNQTLSERDQNALNAIAEQARRLNTLIMALLDLSRIQTGNLTIERASIDLAPIVHRIADELRVGLHAHKIILSLPAEGVTLEGDALRLGQVIHNLLQNAIKYSPEGGDVRLSVEQDQQRVTFAVTDQGIGIPEPARVRLFERFYRANNVDPLQISGFGIGLYIVKEIVELHSGSITVESVEGQGSTFRVTLPRYAPIDHDVTAKGNLMRESTQ